MGGSAQASDLGYEQWLAGRVRGEGEDATESALELFEHANPATLGEAVALVCAGQRPSDEVLDAIAAAWERYRHLRDMPWD